MEDVLNTLVLVANCSRVRRGPINLEDQHRTTHVHMCCTLVCRFRNLIIRTPYRHRVQSNELQLERGIYCSNLGEIPSVLSFPMPLLVHQKPHVTEFMHLLRTWVGRICPLCPLPKLSFPAVLTRAVRVAV